MRKLTDNFGFIKIPCCEILYNDDVEGFIENQYRYHKYSMIQDFKFDMGDNKNNCYYEYTEAYNKYKITKQVDLIDEQTTQYIRMKRNPKNDLRTLNIHTNFRMVEFLI